MVEVIKEDWLKDTPIFPVNGGSSNPINRNGQLYMSTLLPHIEATPSKDCFGLSF